LVNKTHNHIPSAKLNMLMNSLKEIIAEGHKVLIFSQFTSMLGFVKKEVERRAYKHVYLDGKTADRAAVVKEFQEDEECKVFLISLKAGGVGLNLTAASYVFLLDPWWNPAIEAQAVDRAYRIGQKNPVFAYRMVSRGTVEEKILEMQADKRALADSVIGQGQVSEKINGDDMRRLLSF
ncbi:MAG: SWF/SNF helicase family protein, partial [Lentisphaeraceae bacterium]|nr:SWF/SNF helicase family protein [Lentisphaeraceae bacterium]